MYGKVESKEDFLDFIREMEQDGIWIQPLPCWAVMDEELLEFAAFLAIKDHQKSAEIARKMNAQVLLRFAGTDQIRDAVKKFGIKDHQSVALVIVTENEMGKKKVKRELKEKSIIELKTNNQSLPHVDLNKIRSLYGLTDRYLRAIQEGRDINRNKAIRLGLMEQMGLLGRSL